jgi:type VI secretion system protein ImpA
MTADWVDELLAPLAADQPCGASLDGTPRLAAFDTFRLWGRSSWIETGANNVEVERIPEWTDVKRKALEALGESKDLRILPFLGAAALRTDGLPAFTRILHVGAEWVERYWEGLFPLIEDGDAIPRCSALNCFADQLAVVDGLRRVPLVSHRQLGRFGLRDIESAADGTSINAAFTAAPLEELQTTRRCVAEATDALQRIEATFLEKVGVEDAPTFDLLRTQMQSIDRVLRAHMKARPDGGGLGVDPDEEEGGRTAGSRGEGLGAVASRQDAIRALDAVAAFFRQSEPSSPVPLLVERAKRLVSKDFMEVLADIAPGALEQARAAGGLKDGQ